MAHHKLTVSERLRGARKALASSRTPARLKAGLRRYIAKVERSK